MIGEAYPITSRVLSAVTVGGLALSPLLAGGCGGPRAEVPAGVAFYNDKYLEDQCGSNGPDDTTRRVVESYAIGDATQAVKVRNPGGASSIDCSDYVWVDAGLVTTS